MTIVAPQPAVVPFVHQGSSDVTVPEKKKEGNAGGTSFERRVSYETEISGPLVTAAMAKPLLVIKVGTSTLMDPNKHVVSLSHLGRFVDTVCNLKAMGYQVVIVSSGAVGVGCVHLKLPERPTNLAGKQAVAAVGQCRLMRIYEDLFSIREEITAQLLITRTDLVDRNRFLNFKRSLLELLALGVTPIINENDSVATEFLRFGDNDTLAAYCAISVSASWLVLLTDVHCLYTANPRVVPNAKAIAFVSRVTEAEKLLDTRTNAGTSWGSGGMETKIVSAKIATAAGIHTALAHGQFPERILDILSFAESNAQAQDREGVFPVRDLTGDIFSDKRFESSAGAATAAAAAGNDGMLDTFISTCNNAMAPPQPSQGGGMLGIHPSPSRADLIQTAADELLPQQHQLEQQLEIVHQIEQQLGDVSTGGSMPFDACGDPPSTVHFQESPSAALAELGLEDSTDGDEPENDIENLSNATLASRGIVAVDPVGAWQDRLPYVGTIFVGQECTQSIRDQRRWILSLPVRGVVYVDEGCGNAVVLEKKSLFAAGIKRVDGDFVEGDVIAICKFEDLEACCSMTPAGESFTKPSLALRKGTEEGTLRKGREEASPRDSSSPATVPQAEACKDLNAYPNEIARCLINFPAQELDKIKGLRSSDFQGVLGYNCDPEVAHRSNIIFVDTTQFIDDEELEL